MAEEVSIKISADASQASQSVSSLKKQLREAQQEVQAMSDKFGATSAQAVAAAKKAGELKDRIGDAKALTDAFNPDRKFQAFSAALQGAVGGISAVQGAMGLLGVENQNVQQTLLKVQSAMALSQGINSVLEARDSFKNLGAVIQSTAIFQKANNAATTIAIGLQRAFGAATIGTGRAFTILKGAIAATGIGLLIVGVSSLINKISSWTSSTDDNEKAQQNLNDTIELQNRLLDDNLKSISFVTKMNVLRAKQAGKSSKEIHDIEIKGLQDESTALKDNYNKRLKYEETPEFRKLKLEDKKKYWEETNKVNQQYVEKGNQIALTEQEFLTATAEEGRNKRRQSSNKSNTEEAQRRKQEQEDIKNDTKSAFEKAQQLADELFLQEIKDEKEREEVRIAMQYEKDKKEIEASKAKEKEKQLALDILKKKYEADIAAVAEADKKKKDEENAQQMMDLLDQLYNENEAERLALEERKKIVDEYNKQDLEATKFLQEKKLEAVEAGLNLIGALAGKNEVIGNILYTIQKAIEIGKIISSTTSAIQQVNAATAAVPTIIPPGVPNPAYAVAVASAAKKILGLKIGAAAGIASIAASSISKFKSGGGGGIGSAGNISGGGAAPIIPQSPQATLTQLDQGTINRLGSATNRAYVVETDITNSQERIRRINRAARLN